MVNSVTLSFLLLPMQVIILLLVLIPAIFILVGYLLSAPAYRGPLSDHFDGQRFINPGGVKAKGLKEVFKWMFTRKRSPWKAQAPNSSYERPLKFFNDGLKITFINHTTFLIQFNGVNILTDPVWSKRVSPFSWAGPKRVAEPGIRLEDLPRIHLVLLSHNHYDHLDINTVRVIAGAHHPRFVVPLGVKAYLDQHGISNVVEMDWWQKEKFESIEINAVPAQHFSGRGMFDRDKTLWCGYTLEAGERRIYFAGDTGYNTQTFKDIAKHFKSFDISIIPIGAYMPRWFMSPIHISPEEAVKIHLDTNSKKSIASHFGTFPLADDGYEDPINDLRTALATHDLPEKEFIILKNGASVIIDEESK